MAVQTTVHRQHEAYALPLRRWAASPRRRVIALFALSILVMIGSLAAAQGQTVTTPTERSATAASTPMPLAIQRLEAARTRLAAFRAEAAPTRGPNGAPAASQDIAAAESLLAEIDEALLALDARIAALSRQRQRQATMANAAGNAEQARILDDARREVMERRLTWLRLQAQPAAETTALQEAALRLEASEAALRSAIARAAPPPARTAASQSPATQALAQQNRIEADLQLTQIERAARRQQRAEAATTLERLARSIAEQGEQDSRRAGLEAEVAAATQAFSDLVQRAEEAEALRALMTMPVPRPGLDATAATSVAEAPDLGLSPVLLIGAGLGLALLLIALVFGASRRRRRTTEAESPPRAALVRPVSAGRAKLTQGAGGAPSVAAPLASAGPRAGPRSAARAGAAGLSRPVTKASPVTALPAPPAPGAPAPLTPIAVAVAAALQDTPPPPTSAALPADPPADARFVSASGSPDGDEIVNPPELAARVEPIPAAPPPLLGMARVRRSSAPRFAAPLRRPPTVARQRWSKSIVSLPASLTQTAWIAPRLPPAERRR